MRRLFALLPLLLSAVAGAQDQTGSADTGVRVSVVMNDDGSRTSYEFNAGEKSAVATTNGPDGKLREKIRYELDDAGRFARGRVFGPSGKFQFIATYKYDAANRLVEESHEAKDGSLIGKIIFRYDAAGHQVGYSAYDGAGKLVGQAGVPARRSPKATP